MGEGTRAGLISVVGGESTGKSTLTTALAPRLPAIVVGEHTAFRHSLGLPAAQAAESGALRMLAPVTAATDLQPSMIGTASGLGGFTTAVAGTTGTGTGRTTSPVWRDAGARQQR